MCQGDDRRGAMGNIVRAEPVDVAEALADKRKTGAAIRTPQELEDDAGGAAGQILQAR